MPPKPLRVAIIGAGPSGFYTAAALLQSDLDVSIDLYDRLPAPYGLVRYGVAPDHPKIKSVERVFSKLCLDPRLRLLGNVEIGGDGEADLSRSELLEHYDQVVYAVGGQSDRRLGIDGEDLAGSHSSTAFVAWYSGHPDFVELPVDLSARAAVVVGIGNVAMDVARILARSPDELATTDIADYALAALRDSQVRDIYVLARRGPVQAKCSPPELKEIAELAGTDVVVYPEDLELDPGSRAALEDDRTAQRNLDLLTGLAAEEPAARGGERRIHFRFLTSPIEIAGDAAAEDGGRVTGVAIERNRLEEAGDGYLRSVATGERETLDAGLVIRAIGYRSLPLADLPFDDRRGVITNRDGRIVDAGGEVVPREYVVGWVKRGPSGLIGSNKPDGKQTAAAMIEDAADLPDTGDARRSAEAVDRRLAERGVRVVRFPDWQRLDALEIAAGEPHGRPRVKLTRVAEMLAALDR